MNRDKLLEQFDVAFNAEIEKVSSLEYNSNKICRHFAAKLRERFAALLSQQEQEPEWYTGVDGHGCRRFYHKEEVRPGIGFDECLYLAPPPAQGWNEAKKAAVALCDEEARQTHDDSYRCCAEYLSSVISALARPSQAQEPQGCTRSHPHENMNEECEQKTVEARAANAERCKELRESAASGAGDEHSALQQMISALQEVDSIAQVFLEGGYGRGGDQKAYRKLASLGQSWLRIKRALSQLPAQVTDELPIATDDDVERVAKLAGWNNRSYMTPADYSIWCARMRKFVALSRAQHAAPEGWLPMETAPKDGTMLRLLVRFDDNATEDSAEPCPTIGANTFDHSDLDEWKFAGWNWSHDCFTEGIGTPVGWLPFAAPSTQPQGGGK